MRGASGERGGGGSNVHGMVIHTCGGAAGKGRRGSLGCKSRTSGKGKRLVVDNLRYKVDPRPMEPLP